MHANSRKDQANWVKPTATRKGTNDARVFTSKYKCQYHPILYVAACLSISYEIFQGPTMQFEKRKDQ
jgi:hypothetical protein